MQTEHRPRIGYKTNEKLKEVKEQLEYFRDEEDEDISDYLGRKGNITEDKIISRALTMLQEEGLVE